MTKRNRQTEKFTSDTRGNQSDPRQGNQSLDSWIGNPQLVLSGGLRNRIIGKSMSGLPVLSELALLANSNVLGAGKSYPTVSSSFE